MERLTTTSRRTFVLDRADLVSIRGKQPKLKGVKCHLSKVGLSLLAEGKSLENGKKLIGIVFKEPKYINRITILWNGYKQPKVYFRNEILLNK
jgi:hypothetical protein